MKEKTTHIYLLLLFTIFPLLIHNGYRDILGVKTGFFYFITAVYMIIHLACAVRDRKIVPQELFVIDKLLLVFGFEVVISWLLQANRGELFLGTYGRNMGVLTILCYIVGYFAISQSFEYHWSLLKWTIIAGMLISGIAVCNHFGLDPLGVYESFDRSTEFISTMGNINTLSAYIGILLPFVMTLFVFTKEKTKKYLYGSFCIVGFAGVIAANSDSAYVTVAVSFFLLIYFAKDAESGLAVVVLAVGFVGTGVVFERCRKLWGVRNCMKLRAGFPKMFINTAFNESMFLVLIVLLVIFCYRKKKSDKAEGFWKRLRKRLFVLTGILCIVGIAAIIGINVCMDETVAKEELGMCYRYLYFGDSWGSKRLEIWKAALTVFGRMNPWEKLIGCGASGFYFASQRYLTADELAVFAERGVLVDAHNEYLQYLVTFGIVGLCLFIAICASTIYYFWKKGKQENIMLAFMMLLIAFMIQAAVNNAHIYIDSLVYGGLAIGISIKRKG